MIVDHAVILSERREQSILLMSFRPSERRERVEESVEGFRCIASFLHRSLGSLRSLGMTARRGLPLGRYALSVGMTAPKGATP